MSWWASIAQIPQPVATFVAAPGDDSKLVTNELASRPSSVRLADSLPLGFRIGVLAVEAFAIDVVSPDDCTFRVGGTVNGGPESGLISDGTKGAFIEFVHLSASRWIATQASGSWGAD